jgi:predicted CXXCH cytochrome family protein
VFGTGWWKYAPDVAEKLLVKEGPELCFGCHTDMPEALKKKEAVK